MLYSSAGSTPPAGGSKQNTMFTSFAITKIGNFIYFCTYYS